LLTTPHGGTLKFGLSWNEDRLKQDDSFKIQNKGVEKDHIKTLQHNNVLGYIRKKRTKRTKLILNRHWACLQGSPSIVVTATDFCAPNWGLPDEEGGWCNFPREHFEMSVAAFSGIAKTIADIVPVQYRRYVMWSILLFYVLHPLVSTFKQSAMQNSNFEGQFNHWRGNLH
jgi:Lytic transglycolase